MANHKSAIKRHKQSLKHAARNRAARTRVKNAVKAVRAAITGNDKEQASSALTVAASVLAKAAGKGRHALEEGCPQSCPACLAPSTLSTLSSAAAPVTVIFFLTDTAG